MAEDIRFLTMKEVCFKLQITYGEAIKFLNSGKLIGIKTSGGSWRIADPGPKFAQYVREAEEHLLHVPLLSLREVAAVTGLTYQNVYFHIRKRKLKPSAVQRCGKNNKLFFFTFAEVRRFLAAREKTPRKYVRNLELARLIQWAQQLLEESRQTAAPGVVRDELDEEVTQILKLPEPERSQSLQALLLKLDKTQLLLQAVQAGPQAYPIQAPDTSR